MTSADVRTGTEVGDLAPDFELPNTDGKAWRLAEHRGKVVALVFYPKDETPVCTKQMCSMRDRWDDYAATGADVVAISVGSELVVEELTQRLRNDGIAVVDGPRRTGDGYYESVIIDPDGNRIEICC